MRAFLNHLAYDFGSALRDRGRLLMFYLFPLVFFGLCAAFMTAVNPFFREAMLPGMVLFAVMSASLLAAPSALVQARENGVFRSFRVNGVPAASILSIPVIGAALHVTVVASVVSLAGLHVFGGRAPASAVGFAAAAALSYAAFAGVGVLIGVAASSDSAATLAAQLVFIPSMLLGGLMVPERLLPAGLHRVACLLPATHCMRVFAGLGGGGELPWSSVGVLVASVASSIGLALALFEWDSRSNQPSPKRYAAFLGVVPYAVAALFGA